MLSRDGWLGRQRRNAAVNGGVPHPINGVPRKRLPPQKLHPSSYWRIRRVVLMYGPRWMRREGVCGKA